MWKTFIAELKHIFHNKLRPWEWLVVCIIPFLYGFLYMNAYWNPFGHTDKLRIATINLDKETSDYSSSSKNYIKELQLKGKSGIHINNKTYHLNIQDASGIYADNNWTVDKAEEAVKNNKYDAVIIVNKGFDSKKQLIYQTFEKDIADLVANTKTFNQVILDINYSLSSLQNDPLVTFYNSAKNSYIGHEMTNFGAGISAFNFNTILPTAQDIYNGLPQGIKNIVKVADIQNLLDMLGQSTNINNFIDTSNSIGGNVDTYGFGLSPYFMCIGLWAGAITMIFLFKNKRYYKGANSIKHYFGKSLAWIWTGWIQAIILATGVTIQGVKADGSLFNNWQLYLMCIFLSTIFVLIVQAVGYIFRYSDLGEYAAVLILILQLISSSGTFPVEVQNRIFCWLHPIVPFTYGIQAIREMLSNPDVGNIFASLGIIIAFPTILIPISIAINYRFDRKTKIQQEDRIVYKSFEIELEDF